MPTNFSNLNSTIDGLLGYQLRRVSLLSMSKLADALQPLDLRIADVTVLYQIAESPNITSSEIGRALGIQRANMTPLVAGLVARGYLGTKAKDGRSQSLLLTRAGRKVYQQAKKIIDTHEQQFFSMLTDDERLQLSHLLIKTWEGHASE